jgi:O-glycosyl hydrolase
MRDVHDGQRESVPTKFRFSWTICVIVLAVSLLFLGLRSKTEWRARIGEWTSAARLHLLPAPRDLERSYMPVGLSARLQRAGGVQDTIVTIDNSARFQTIEGFGAAHNTLARGPDKNALNPELRAQAIDAVYGQVRLTTGSVEVGVIEAPDDAADPWAQQANDDDDPFHFNWRGFNFAGSDSSKQTLIDLAQPKGFDNYYPGLKVSVRWANKWMKAIRATDYNRYLEEAAEQVAAGMIHWRDSYGIVTKYVQIFNEPTSGNHELDPGSVQEVIDIIKRVGSRLRKEGFRTVKFVVPGEETDERSLEVATAILADPDARQYVGAIAYHSYPYGSTYAVVANILRTSGRGEPDVERIAARRRLRDLGKQYGLPVWMTEVSHGRVAALSFDGLLGRAIHIHDELEYANASAYFGMTNLADTMPVHGRAHDAFSEEGDIAIADISGGRIYVTGMGFAIGHYARWLPRGAVRLEASSSNPLVLVTAFRDEAQNRLVLVLINSRAEPANVSLRLKDFALRLPLKVIGEQSTAKGAWAPVIPLALDDPSQIRFLAGGRSVTTLAAGW